MSIEIRLPNITAEKPYDQIAQIRSYLYQFSSELQWALNTIENGEKEGNNDQIVNSPASSVDKENTTIQQFGELKSLIIKSADIVASYYEKIDSMIELSHKYAAQSDFGEFIEDANNRISANSNIISQELNRVQILENLVDGMSDKILSQESYIHYGAVGTTLDDTGLASETAPGFEIGDYQQLEDGSTTITNRRFARFTAYGLELFGEEKEAPPVAYIKQSKLYINNAEIRESLRLGGYMVTVSEGIFFDWIGGV